MARRCFCAVSLLSVLAVLARTEESGYDLLRVGFERPEYSVGRGEGSVKVKLVFSAYTGDRSEDDSFDLRVAAEAGTAVAEVDYHFREKLYAEEFKIKSHYRNIHVQILLPLHDSPSTDCTTSSKTFSLSLLVEDAFKTSVELSPHPTTTIIIIDDPQGDSVDECWRRKLAELERTLSEDISSKINRIHQLEETLKSKQESCSPDQIASPPTDVSAVLVGGTRLTVSWKKPEAGPVPIGYVIYYKKKGSYSTQEGSGGWEGEKAVVGCPNENITACSISLTTRSGATNYVVSVATFSAQSAARPAVLRAKPPDRIWALLQGTNLTVFWRQPEGVWPTLGNYTHMYIIYYRAGSGGVEGSTISGCTNLNCNSAVTGVEADSANYTVTMATVNEDDSLSYRSEATVAVRATANPPYVRAKLEGTRLIVSWRKPYGGATPTGYEVHYRINSEKTSDSKLEWEDTFLVEQEDMDYYSYDRDREYMDYRREYMDYRREYMDYRREYYVADATANYSVSMVTVSEGNFNSPPSTEVMAERQRAEPPTDVSASLEGTRLTVSWKKPVGGATPTGYEVYYGVNYYQYQDDDHTYVGLENCSDYAKPSCSAVLVIANATESYIYMYRVYVVTVSEGNPHSHPSRSAQARKLKWAEPPTDVSASQEGTRLSVSWKKPVGGATPTGYEVFYGVNYYQYQDDDHTYSDRASRVKVKMIMVVVVVVLSAVLVISVLAIAGVIFICVVNQYKSKKGALVTTQVVSREGKRRQNGYQKLSQLPVDDF